jgi:recombination protein RecA
VVDVNIEEIMARLGPKTRKRVQTASEIDVTLIPTPSVAMNMALKGGIGLGRQSLFWGNKSSGKSSFCLQLIAQAQRDGRTCAWVDVEHSFDPKWATRLGVDCEKLIVSEVKTITDMTAVVVELMEAGIDLVVVDSITALLSSSFFSKDGDMKDLENTKQIGGDARDLANSVRMMNFANEKTALILISQIRNQITTWGANPRPTGGKAVEFFSSTIVKLTSSATEAKQITGDVYVGDKIFEQQIGRPVHWLVEFNKLGPPNQTGDYDFYYDGPDIGVDVIGETLDLADKFGVIEHKPKTAWYTIDGVKVQGRQTVVNMLKADRDLYDRIVKELHEQI